MKAKSKATQAHISPEKGLEYLKEGNRNFQQKKQELPQMDLAEQRKATTKGQFPFATILSCIDSRVPAEIIFDQGLGDLFSIRIAGNVVNDDVLGSMEFGAKLAGARLIVVLGHTGCGAVQGACDDARLGKLTGLLAKIRPAVAQIQAGGAVDDFPEAVARQNVRQSLQQIRAQSSVLHEMEAQEEIMIVGAMYDIETGAVTFGI